MGVLIAMRTRKIVVDGARTAVKLERSAMRLVTVMRDHHDARTLPSSASLNAGMAARALEREPDPTPWLDLTRRVVLRLERVNDCVSVLRERSYVELLGLEGSNPKRRTPWLAPQCGQADRPCDRLVESPGSERHTYADDAPAAEQSFFVR